MIRDLEIWHEYAYFVYLTGETNRMSKFEKLKIIKIFKKNPDFFGLFFADFPALTRKVSFGLKKHRKILI